MASGSDSFQGDTPVSTPTGSQAIDTLKVGGQVTAYDSKTGKAQPEAVQHVFINYDDNLLDVTIADAKPVAATNTKNKQQDAAVATHGGQAPPSSETLHTTTEHPFLTDDRGFVDAVNLIPGEHVTKLDGSLGVVISVTIVPGQAVRYNLTVQDEHTYAVGQGQWVVHNTSCQVGYGNSNLSKAVQDARKVARDRDGNYAAGLLDDGDTIIGRSAGKGRAGIHAEEDLLSQAKARGKQLVAVYSEYEPCANKCGGLLAAHNPAMDITWSWARNGVGAASSKIIQGASKLARDAAVSRLFS